MKYAAPVFLAAVILVASLTTLASQDEHGVTPLMEAVAKGEKTRVQQLLTKKEDLEVKNENGDPALAMAIGNEQDDIAMILIKAGAKLDVLSKEQQNNLLYRAVSANSKKALRWILKKAPEQIDAKNAKGDTALHEAARYGSEDTLKTLLKAGAKRDLKNNEGKTPLEIARSLKNKTAEKLLK